MAQFLSFAIVAAVFFVKRPLTRDERLALGMHELRLRKNAENPVGFN